MLGQSQEKNVGKYENTSDKNTNSNINKNYTSLDQRKHIHDLLTTHSQTHNKLRQKDKEQNTEEKPYKNYLTNVSALQFTYLTTLSLQLDLFPLAFP